MAMLNMNAFVLVVTGAHLFGHHFGSEITCERLVRELLSRTCKSCLDYESKICGGKGLSGVKNDYCF